MREAKANEVVMNIVGIGPNNRYDDIVIMGMRK
jgi:hypothetical protein